MSKEFSDVAYTIPRARFVSDMYEDNCISF